MPTISVEWVGASQRKEELLAGIKKDDETVFVVGTKFARWHRLKEKNT
jgi:hypothetical protein